MARLLDTRTEPPGGWRYVQLETGCVLTGGSLHELIERVIEHRRYKKLEGVGPWGIQLEIEAQLCNGLEPRFCRAERGETYRPTKDLTRELTSEKAIAFSKTVFEAVKAGEFVDKAESARRAAICRGCQFNKPAGGCVCGAFYAMVDALVPKARVEPGINVCAACGCTLKAKVLLPLSVIKAGDDRDINFPAHCWQRTSP